MMDPDIEMSSVKQRNNSEQDDEIKPEYTHSNEYGSTKYVKLKDIIMNNADNGRF